MANEKPERFIKRTRTKDDSGKVWKDSGRTQFRKEVTFEAITNNLFIAFSIIGGIQIYVLSQFGGTAVNVASGIQVMQVILGTIWILSTFAGYTGGRVGRPYIGILMIGAAIFVYSFQFTGTVGASFFGPYWASVEGAGEAVFEPIGGAISGVGQTFGDVGLLMTCPNCYFAEVQRRQDIARGRIKQGGTTKSVELVNFEAINYGSAMPVIDPRLPLIGTIDIENKGEFDARNIEVRLLDLMITDPEKISAAHPEEGHYDLQSDECVFSSCSGLGEEIEGEDECIWDKDNEIFMTDELRSLTFECGDPPEYKKWAKGNTITESKYYLDDIKTETIDGETYTFYENGGFQLDVPIEYSFEYSVSASLDVTVMDEELFKEIGRKPEGVISQYSGGPAKLTLWTQKQPLRTEEESYGRFAIINTGTGIIMKGTYIFVEISETSGLEFINEPDLVSLIGFNKENCEFDDELNLIRCELSDNLETGETATGLFNFKYKLTDVEQKTITFTAELPKYRYVGKKELKMTILQAPIQ